MAIDEPLTKGPDGEYHCPKCGGIMKPEPRTFHWRGVYFAGLVCKPCNGLWDNPEDSFFGGVKKSTRKEEEE